MRRTTIDFGIDLGTTNSTVAVVDAADPKVIPNKFRSGTTPSAVWLDKRGQLHVGEEAKQRALTGGDEEIANSDFEFKQRMGQGTGAAKAFARSGRSLSPEDLSAEVLKSLRTDVQSELDEDLTAAVITVPAAFENPATAATQRAAKLAGISACPLLLEPVAASLAYGFQSENDNVYWLVFDFGGGTFDAAVMRIRDGFIHVENHEGDNQLGGKLIDWDIVTERLMPAAAAQFDLPDLRRGNPRWQSAIGRLKYGAEQAKIEVCRTRKPVEIFIDPWCEDARGRPVEFSYTLTPEDVQALTAPYLQRMTNLCRRTLQEAKLSPSAMERIIMVGGSTLNPWIREAVQAEFGRPLEFGIDPVTVVARGAAIFASTLELKADSSGGYKAPAGVWRVETEQQPVGNVPDPDAGGRVTPPEGASCAGCTIELVDPMTTWRSGKITLGGNGVFMTQLYAATRGRHNFRIELRDPDGAPLPTDPETIPYTYMENIPTSPPAVKDIGVGLANGSVATYVRKGDRLPLRKMMDHITTVPLRSGRADDVLRIPLLEGEHRSARRNYQIGVMEISGLQMSRDLPEGSQVEITVKMDESQQIGLHVFIESQELDFETVFEPVSEVWSLDRMIREAETQRKRLDKAQTSADLRPTPETEAILDRIAKENLVEQIQRMIAAAATDPGSLPALDRRLRELAALIDDFEDALEVPTLIQAATSSKEDAERVVGDFGEPKDTERLATLAREFHKAVELRKPDMLRRSRDDFDALWFTVVDRHLPWHVGRFERLSARKSEMTDAAQAEQIIAQGQRAIRNEDIPALKSANRQLALLLPRSPEDEAHGNVGGTLTRT